MARSPYFRNPTYTDFKESVRVASTASVNINLPGSTIDGVALTFGDTVLLKDQGAPENNGIYVWRAANLPMQRTAGGIDHQISSGMLVPVEEGTANADKIFMLTTDEPIETGVTPLVFEELLTALGGGAPFDPADDQTITGNWEFTSAIITDGVLTGGMDVNLQGGNVLLDGGHLFTDGGILHLDNGARLEATDSTLAMLEAGDTEPKLAINANGSMEWSDGINPPDVVVSRSSSYILDVSSNVQVGGSIQVSDGLTLLGNSAVSGTLASTVGADFLRAGLSGDASVRFTADHGGAMSWGDGASPADVELYRSDVGTVKFINTGAATRVAVQVDDAPVDGSDLVNKDYADGLLSGGTTQQKAANYSIDLSTDYGLLVNPLGTGGVTMTLPAVHTIGAKVLVSDHTGQASPTDFIKLVSADGDTINGAADYDITTAYGYVEVISNGTNWVIVGSN